MELMTSDSISNIHTTNTNRVSMRLVWDFEFLVEAAFWCLGTITLMLFGFLNDSLSNAGDVSSPSLLSESATVVSDWWVDGIGGIDDDDESMYVDWLTFDNKWLITIDVWVVEVVVVVVAVVVDVAVDDVVINLVASPVSIITGIDFDILPVTFETKREKKKFKLKFNSLRISFRLVQVFCVALNIFHQLNTFDHFNDTINRTIP